MGPLASGVAVICGDVQAVSISDIPLDKPADPPLLIQLTAQSAHVSKVLACR